MNFETLEGKILFELTFDPMLVLFSIGAGGLFCYSNSQIPICPVVYQPTTLTITYRGKVQRFKPATRHQFLFVYYFICKPVPQHTTMLDTTHNTDHLVP